MPGTAKMTFKSCATNHGPNQPLTPNTNTYIKPTTTGETENGRSINVVSNCLPRNSNLAIAHAAATPNTTFKGIAIAAANKVKRMADKVSGCVIACRYTAKPLRNASVKTDTSGSNRNKPKNAKDSIKMLHFTQFGSRVAGLYS